MDVFCVLYGKSIFLAFSPLIFAPSLSIRSDCQDGWKEARWENMRMRWKKMLRRDKIREYFQLMHAYHLCAALALHSLVVLVVYIQK